VCGKYPEASGELFVQLHPDNEDGFLRRGSEEKSMGKINFSPRSIWYLRRTK